MIIYIVETRLQYEGIVHTFISVNKEEVDKEAEARLTRPDFIVEVIEQQVDGILLDKETIKQLLEFLSHEYISYDKFPKILELIKEMRKYETS